MSARRAADPQRARAVQENRSYRHIIDSLAGAQEYLAGEKIYDAASCDRYDLVVLDTPPKQSPNLLLRRCFATTQL